MFFLHKSDLKHMCIQTIIQYRVIMYISYLILDIRIHMESLRLLQHKWLKNLLNYSEYISQQQIQRNCSMSSRMCMTFQYLCKQFHLQQPYNLSCRPNNQFDLILILFGLMNMLKMILSHNYQNSRNISYHYYHMCNFLIDNPHKGQRQ